MARRALVVCTANVCRSPVAAALLHARLDGRLDVDGEPWTVTSAGIAADPATALDARTLDAASEAGVDLAGHCSRRLDESLLASDGADLVLTMTRAHLRAVIGVDPGAWPRTFTLKELVRRASTVPPASPAGGVAGWLRDVAAGRRAADLITPDPADDVDDPYGRPRRYHDEMVAEVAAVVDRLVALGPWPSIA